MQVWSIFSIPQISVFLAAFALLYQSCLKLRKWELPASASPEPWACHLWWCHLKPCWEAAPTGSQALNTPGWLHKDCGFMPPVYPSSAGTPDHGPLADGHWTPAEMVPSWLNDRRAGSWVGVPGSSCVPTGTWEWVWMWTSAHSWAMLSTHLPGYWWLCSRAASPS